MKVLLKYFRLYFGISLVLVMLGVIVIGMSAVADFHEYAAYPIFEQQPYFLVILQFIAQTMSSLKAMFGSLTACLIGLFIAVHFRRLYGKLREMI